MPGYPVAGGSHRKKEKKRSKKIPRQEVVCTHEWNLGYFRQIREEARRLRSISDDEERARMAKKMSVSPATMSTIFLLLVFGIVGVTIYGFSQIFRAVYRRFSGSE